MEDLGHSKAIKLLKTLEKVEQKSFRLFLQSPFFNENEKLVACFDLFSSELLHNESGKLSKREVYAYIYPEAKEYQAYKVTRLTSGMVEMFEQFNMIQENLQQDFFAVLSASQGLQRRGLIKESEKRLKLLEEKLATNQDSHFHYYAFRLAEHRLESASHSHRMRSMDKLQVAYQLLDTFQKVQKLRLLCATINQARITQGDIPPWVFEEIKFFEANSDGHVPLMELYFRSLQLLLKQTDAACDDLVKAVKRHKASFEEEVMREFYQQALNHHIRAYNRDQSDRERCRQLLDFYMEMIQENLILQGNKISAWNYKNIASLHARIGELDRLEQFIHDFDGRIARNDATCARAFVNGLLAFYQGKYLDYQRKHAKTKTKGAASWMLDVLNSDSENIFWELEARAYRLLIKFELSDFEDVMPNQESLRMFIDRNKKSQKISKAHHQAYGNLIKTIRKLHLAAFASPEKAQVKLSKLLGNIAEMKHLAQKQWFIDKIQSLQTPKK